LKTYRSITQLIGNTPLLTCENLMKEHGCRASVLAKLECMNPAGSAKDRVALQMILDAEKNGFLSPGATIIEPTSGNTGIGLASIGAARGYRTIFTMPETMSKERQLILRAFGAQVVLTDGRLGMKGAIQKAEELNREIPGSFYPGQFDSPSNPNAHEAGTGPEIWEDTEGAVDVFISAVGTGGTVTGTGRYLKKKNPNVQIIGVEPANSAVLSGKPAGAHGIQGIGAGFIPSILDQSLLDRIVTVTEEEAYAASRLFAKTEGLLVGISSGAALHAALTLALEEEYENKRIVVLLPDTGERYLSTPLFQS